MADYGLDPSVLNYVQGGAMPSIAPYGGADSSIAPNPYGLDPSVLGAVQNGFAPPDQVTTSTLGPRGGSIDPPLPSAPPTPPITASTLGPRGRNNFGVSPEVAGAPGSPEVADTQAPSVTGGALPTQDIQATPVATQLQPDQVIGAAAPLTPQQLAASNKQYDKQQAVAAAQAASPEGLAEKADAENRAAIDKERQAATDASAAEQAQNTATATALQDSLDRQAKQEALDVAKRQQDQANAEKYTAQYAQQVKDAADYKVDTNRDVGMSGLIAVALSGIGDAIAHRNGPNAALQIISEAQDKRIADQWAQKKALGDKAAGTKDVLDVYRKGADDDRQAMQLQRAAESQKLADQIRMIGAQYANPAAKARAEQVAAGLDQKAAAITAGEGTRKAQQVRDAQEQANKRAELGIAGGHLALAQKQFDAQQKENDRNFALHVEELNAQGNAAAAKAAADKAKDLKENGVYDPNSANLLLDASNPNATKALAQAQQLDRLAAAQTDPQQQAALAKQANDIRTQAKLDYGAVIEDKDNKIKDQLGGAQRLVNATQRIREALADGSITDRDTRAALKTEADNAFTAWATANNVKASSREYEVYKEAMGSLDSVSATNINKGPLTASLGALDKGASVLAATLLHGHGIKPVDENGNPWVLTAEKTPQATQLKGDTSIAQGDAATPGVAAGFNPVGSQGPIAQAGRAAGRMFFGGSEPDPALVAENNANTGPTGLSKEDDSKVLGLIKTYGKVSPAENDRVLTNLMNVVGDPGSDPQRQAAANSVIARVKAESPVLYKKLLEQLPADRRKQLTQFDVPPIVINRITGQQ